jgi:hypothetical protein
MQQAGTKGTMERVRRFVLAVHWVRIFYLEEMFERDVDKRPLGDLLANTDRFCKRRSTGGILIV